jgi:hypothetical protein
MLKVKTNPQKMLQLYPRVINDKMAPKKRFNMREKNRLDLLQNSLATLIKQETIKTTVSKAKFIQFYAERVLPFYLSAVDRIGKGR